MLEEQNVEGIQSWGRRAFALAQRELRELGDAFEVEDWVEALIKVWIEMGGPEIR